VRQRLKADKERSHDRFYNRRKFHGPELPREPARCSRNWLVRLTFSSPASTLWGNEQKLRSHWCNKIALPPGFLWLALVFSFALDHLRRSKGGMIALARTGDDTVEHVFYYTVHGYMQSDTDAASSSQKANV
jgi:hypothetical protein